LANAVVDQAKKPITNDIVLNIFNRHADYTPMALTDFNTNRAGLGRVILALDAAGHVVMSISFNGNIADMVIIANDSGWREVFSGAIREPGGGEE
jgi:hypothetical protein